jgi:hypothetical protein
MTVTEGIHDGISMATYQADKLTDRPTLSAGLAKLLLTHSPKHAWTQHPRLNPEYERVEEDRFDLGTAVHSLFLQGEDIAEWINAKDWRTNDAQELRTYARRAGRVPLLLKHKPRVDAMLDAVQAQTAELGEPRLFTHGKPEQTLVWEEHGVLCRARCDWLRADLAAIDDLKTAGHSANPHEWCRRTLWAIGADLQVALYRRGVKALTGVTPEFRYCVVECQPPFALSVVSLAPSALEFADRKLDRALATWKECLATDTWPAYPTEVAYAELPPWLESQWWDMEAAAEEVTAA